MYTTSTRGTARGVLASLVLVLVAAACADSTAPVVAPNPNSATPSSSSSQFEGEPAGTGDRVDPVDLSDAGMGSSGGVRLRLERNAPTASASIGSTTATHYTLASITEALASPLWTGAIVGVSQYGGAMQAAVQTRVLGGYPMDGTSYLVVSSGDARTTGTDASYRSNPCVGGYCDTGGLDVHVQVPAGATSMDFDYRLWTTDSLPFNDYFKVFVIDANGVSHEVVSHTIASEFGPGSGRRLSQHLRSKSVDVSAWAGQPITLRFEVADAIDWICATGAFIDNLHFVVPALTLTKVATDNATTVQPGSPMSFTLEVTNSGGSTLSDVALRDELPGGLGLDWSIQPTAGCTIAGTSPETLTCNFGTLAPGASRTVTVVTNTVAASCGVYNNYAVARATGLAPVGDEAQIRVPCDLPPVGTCDGGVTKVTLKYVGSAPLTGEVRGQRRNPSTSDILPAITVGTGPNTLYTFAITAVGGQFTSVSSGRLANNFRLYIGSTLVADFHTSCSAPIYPGMVVGPFEIVEVFSKNGGQIGAP